ncbi:4653_t:CDS:2, partial [Ambispora leptoticha]
MFGNQSNQQQQSKPATTFGGFGTGSLKSSTSTTMTPFSLNKPQTQTSNIFGTSTTSVPTSSTVFSLQPSTTPATSTGFSLQPSTTTSQLQSSIFSSSSLAPSTATTGTTGTMPTTISGLPIYTENNITSITLDTKFHQLPESARKRLMEMAKEIERHKEVMLSIDNSWPDVKETIQSTRNTARNVAQHIHGLTEKLEASRRLINDLCQSLVRQKVYHDNARDASLSTSDTVFQKYLRDTILSMEERIEQYDQNIEELDRHISAIINATQGE